MSTSPRESIALLINDERVYYGFGRSVAVAIDIAGRMVAIGLVIVADEIRASRQGGAP